MYFTHLHVHSHYSLLDGLAQPEKLLEQAQKDGLKALALTDHGVMYGAIEFYTLAQKMGIKPIIGCEFYLSPDSLYERSQKQDIKFYHLILLAKNQTGYENLLKLVSIGELEGFYYKPRIDKTVLKKHSEGLIALSACARGEIPSALLADNYDKAIQLSKEYQKIFGKENFYLELQHHPELPDQKIINESLLKIADEYKIPAVITTDVHYIKKEDKKVQDVLLAIQTGSAIEDEDRFTMKQADLYFKPAEEIIKDFSHRPDLFENIEKIVNQCNLKLDLGKVILPYFETADGEDSYQYLEKLVQENFKKFYSDKNKEAKERLRYELEVIKKTGFTDYFLIIQDFIQFTKKQGILTNTRGSAAGSLVAYVLEITSVDPLKYGLFFERFLNPERIQPPDIDIDIADDRRAELINYITEKYGKDHVAQIITFGIMKSRLAVRDVTRALGYSYSLGDQIAKLIPFDYPINKALKIIPELKQLVADNSEAQEVVEMAQQLEGVARHGSTHAAGVVISREPLVNYSPLQHSSRNDKEIITQYDMYSLEKIGLLKVDILGLANLTIIKNATRIIKKVYGDEIDLNEVSYEDKKVYELLSDGDTVGLFQVECLSGDTIISNTTIKRLYEEQNKKRLISVYLGEGKTHLNEIQEVVKKGKQDVYTLIAENGWYIKSTKEHRFLTDEGWRKLKEIKLGDKILIKHRAKHLIFNTCKSCGKQISGQQEGKSDFCYKCSARFYSNPSKKESREKISAAKLAFYQQGNKPWNYGITIENNKIWKRTAKKISAALKGRSLEERCGKEWTEEFKRKLSLRMSGKNNPMFGKSCPHRKGGFREDLGHYVRSAWEADFARILNYCNTRYNYEPKTFELIKPSGEIVHYTPDFYVKSQNTFYEVKGWLHDKDKEKMDLFQKQYPEYGFVLIDTTKFAEFALKYKNLVSWECPRVPTKESFDFIKVKEIRYSGKEDTYDILMKSPGNNFVANGFLVHNSGGMRRYLQELKPTQFEDIIAMLALYRPGPMELIPQFINRKHGKEKIVYLHPKLEPILKNTYNVCVYQEQLMQIAHDLAGFSMAQADVLRKAVGKKIKSLLDAQKEQMIEGMVKNKITRATAEKIWNWMIPFARYGFNKSHAASYARITYLTAWLKTYYPNAFMAALLTSDFGNLDRIAIEIAECKRLKIKVNPPSVNTSFAEFGIDKQTGDIFFSLAAIKNVGEGVALIIQEERQKNGEFKNLTDFLKRIPRQSLNKKTLESLIKAGALDCFGERELMADHLEEILNWSAQFNNSKNNHQMTLFQEGTSDELLDNLKKKFPQISIDKQRRTSWEKEYLGFYLTSHPLDSYKNILGKIALTATQLNPYYLGKKIKVCGFISKIQQVRTKVGKPMVFTRLADYDNSIEIVLYPAILNNYGDILREDKVLLVEGRMDKRNGSYQIIGERLEEIKSLEA
ncbi:MAG: DNA polymerase III subunit alpha [Candidatus Paceibacterota bacterium]|jgi:DNA polymerase III alpha subunit